MHSRNPPSDTRSESSRPVLAFEKYSGTKASTFHGRVVYRLTFRVRRANGDVVRAVRYAGCYWPVYEPETFAAKSQEWVSDADIVYGPNASTLVLPLEHLYLFDCDRHLGPYF